MPFYFICNPEFDYEMFHEDAQKSFERNIVEANSPDDAIMEHFGTDRESPPSPKDLKGIFVIEVVGNKCVSASRELYSRCLKIEKENAESEQKRKDLEEFERLSIKLGKKV